MMGRNKGKKIWIMLVALFSMMVAGGEVLKIRVASAAANPIKLRMIVSAEPTPVQLTPVLGSGSSVGEPITCNVMESLVDIGKKGEPIPKLATKWESSKDLAKWRFYLRRGVKFHNGDSFTARDVVELAKWSFQERKLSELYLRIPVKEAVAVDNYTVDLIFEEPQPLLLINLRVFLIPPLSISRDNRKMAEEHPIGTGPYRFVEWKRGLIIKMAKFEGYWGPKPQIDEAEITFRGEEAVRLAALQAREADWIQGQSQDEISRAPKVIRMPSPETIWIRFDEYIQKELTGVDPIFADKRVRLAVDYAIDRQALVALYGGFTTLSLGQLASPTDFGFNPGLKSRSYDLERAKALVKEAGVLGRTVTLVSSTDRYSKDREIAEAVAYMIEKTGLKVKLMLMPHSEAKKYKDTTGENRKFNSDILISAADTMLEAESRFPYAFVKDGKFASISDPEPTRLYKEALAERDNTKRGEKVAKAYAYVYEEAHYVPLCKLEWMWGIAKNLEWKADIVGRPFLADMRFTN